MLKGSIKAVGTSFVVFWSLNTFQEGQPKTFLVAAGGALRRIDPFNVKGEERVSVLSWLNPAQHACLPWLADLSGLEGPLVGCRRACLGLLTGRDFPIRNAVIFV